MFMMVEEGIRGGMYQAIYRYAKANNRYVNNYDKSIKPSYLMYLDANNLYGCAMSQKRPVDGFKWVKDLSKFNESFIKNYDENVIKDIFLKQMYGIQKNHLIFIKIYHFYQKEQYQKK